MMRDYMEHALGKASAVAVFLVLVGGLLVCAVPAQQANDTPRRSASLDPAISSLREQVNLAREHTKAGRYVEAGAVLDEARRAAAGLPRAAEREDVAGFLHHLGRAAFHANAYSVALEAFGAALAFHEPRRSERDSLLQELRVGTGEALRCCGKAEEAKQLFERALGSLEGKVPDHDDTLQDARGNLAIVLLDQGEVSRAKALLTQVLEAWQGRRTDEHPDVVRTRQNLASVYLQLGDLHKAHDLLTDVYEVRQRVLPPHHRDRLQAKANLAVAKWNIGDRQVALLMLEEACVAMEATLGKNHPDSLGWQTRLAQIREALGTDAPGRTFEDLEKAYRAAGIDGHGDLRIARLNHARLRSTTAQESVAMLERQLDELQRRSSNAEADFDVQTTRESLAAAYEEIGDTDKALALLQQVVATYAQRLSDGDFVLRKARGNLALLMACCGDRGAGERLLRKVCDDYAKDTPFENLRRLDAEANLGQLELMLEQPAAGVERMQRVLETLRRIAPGDAGRLLPLEANIAGGLLKLGRVQEAKATFETLLATWVKAGVAPDDANVLTATSDLATAEMELGNLEAAVRLTRVVCEQQAQLLPPDHPRVLLSRACLATYQLELGQVQEAHDMLVPVVVGLERAFPDDFLDLQIARENLAKAKNDLGDRRGALALFEKVHQVRLSLPEDSEARVRAMTNLGAAKAGLGDLDAGLALIEAASAAIARILPPDHLSVLLARRNLADVHRQRGEPQQARAILEDVVRIHAGKVDEEHPERLAAESLLAAILADLGDWTGSRAASERIAAIRRRILPPFHPDLLYSLTNLATAMEGTGDHGAALALHEEVLATRMRYLPAEDGDVLAARDKLLRCAAGRGDRERALGLAQDQVHALRASMVAWMLSPRELGAMARDQAFLLDRLLTLATGYGSLDPAPELVAPALVVASFLRNADSSAARASRILSRGGERYHQLLQRGARDAAAVTRLARSSPGSGTDADTHQRALLDALVSRDRTHRELYELVKDRLPLPAARVDADDLRRSLPEGAAALTVLAYSHDPTTTGKSERRLVALLLRREGGVHTIPLGAESAVHSKLEELRAAIASHEDCGPAARELFRRVLEPVLRSLHGETTLYVSMDPALQLVPWDALPTDEGLLGERLRVRTLTSLLDLLGKDRAPDRNEPPCLVAVGGLDYDRSDGVEDLAPKPEPGLTRDGEPGSFRRLERSLREVIDVRKAFDAAFPAGRSVLLTGQSCSKAEFSRAVAAATVLHLATHGFFDAGVPLDALPMTLSPQLAKTAPPPLGSARRLSPLSVTGLAISGANLPTDDLGQRHGILTGEEVAALDLSKCELVVLAACNSGVGLQRAGQDMASLRSAFFGAGAGAVVCSLWPVDDAATQDFMAEFYRRKWETSRPTADALWATKMALRDRGVAFMHWAGWLLVQE